MPKLARRVVLRLRPVQQPAPPPVKSQAKPMRGAMLSESRWKNDLLVSTPVLVKVAPVKVPGAANAPLATWPGTVVAAPGKKLKKISSLRGRGLPKKS